MRDVSQKHCRENQITCFILGNFFSENRDFYEFMGKNTAGRATDNNTLGRTRFACWITKPTDTHSEYLILIAFPRQQALRERTSLLPYTYIAILFGLSEDK
jgi:hypothetical protein